MGANVGRGGGELGGKGGWGGGMVCVLLLLLLMFLLQIHFLSVTFLIANFVLFRPAVV